MAGHCERGGEPGPPPNGWPPPGGGRGRRATPHGEPFIRRLIAERRSHSCVTSGASRLDKLRIRARHAESERMNGERVQCGTKPEEGARTVILPAFLRRELRWHLESYVEPGPDGLLLLGEKGRPSGAPHLRAEVAQGARDRRHA